MAENQKTYGLPNLPNLLSMGLGQLEDLTTGVTSGIYGGASDVSGIGSELLGLPPEIAQFFRNLADDSYQKSSEAFKSILDPKTLSQREIERRLNTPQRDLIEKQLIDPDKMMLFEPPDPVSDLGERLSRLGNLSATSPKVPPEGRPQTIPEEKEESVADLQEEVKADEQLFGREKEAFRKEEEGRLQGTPATPENVDKLNEAFKDAMQDFMDKAGKGKATKGAGTGGGRSLEDYKKEFAKATGINIEGGPDKSNFLMALGLGLMQNRAGKGFDISKILTSVGEATEKAMPKLEEAQKKFDAEKLAAGQYALKAQAKDRATAAAAQKKLNEEKGYFIVPTGGKAGLTAGEYLGNAENGRYMKLSNAQLAALEANPEFSKNFSVLPGEMWGDIVKEAQSPKEIEEKYLKTDDLEPMFTGADEYYSFRVQYPDANKLKKGEYLPPKYIGNAKTDIGKLDEINKSIEKNDKTFREFAVELNKTGIDIPSQVAAKVVQGFRALGIDAGGDTTSIVQLQSILEKLAAENAAEILGESGKTLSDNDRAMVKRIIGEIKISFGESADKDQLVRKMGRLYGKIVGAQRRNLKSAATNLYNAGLTEASKYLSDNPDPYQALGGLSTDLGDTTKTKLSMGPNGLLRLSLI